MGQKNLVPISSWDDKYDENHLIVVKDGKAYAEINGQPSVITAILEKTVVYYLLENGIEDKNLASKKKDHILIDASCVLIGVKPTSIGFARRNKGKKVGEGLNTFTDEEKVELEG